MPHVKFLNMSADDVPETTLSGNATAYTLGMALGASCKTAAQLAVVSQVAIDAIDRCDDDGADPDVMNGENPDKDASLNAYVLLCGIYMNSNTELHQAPEMANVMKALDRLKI